MDFTMKDELSSLVLVIEDQPLYVHKEILAAWSPVFRSMFSSDGKEKDQEVELKEIKLSDKKVEDFIELLHCIYPPIKPINGELNHVNLIKKTIYSKTVVEEKGVGRDIHREDCDGKWIGQEFSPSQNCDSQEH